MGARRRTESVRCRVVPLDPGPKLGGAGVDLDAPARQAMIREAHDTMRFRRC